MNRPGHGEDCLAPHFADPALVCNCGLAALEAKAAKWDAATQGGRVAVSGLSNVVMAIELAQLRANDRRWRTVERAVEEGVGFRAWRPPVQDNDYFVEAISGVYHSAEGHGPTLAAAVDQMQERMDKEATK